MKHRAVLSRAESRHVASLQAELLVLIAAQGVQVRILPDGAPIAGAYIPGEKVIALSRSNGSHGMGVPRALDHLFTLAHEFGHYLSHQSRASILGRQQRFLDARDSLLEEIIAWDYAENMLRSLGLGRGLWRLFSIVRGCTIHTNSVDAAYQSWLENHIERFDIRCGDCGSEDLAVWGHGSRGNLAVGCTDCGVHTGHFKSAQELMRHSLDLDAGRTTNLCRGCGWEWPLDEEESEKEKGEEKKEEEEMKSITAIEDIKALPISKAFDEVFLRHKIISDEHYLDPSRESDEDHGINCDMLRRVSADVIGRRYIDKEDHEGPAVEENLGSIEAVLGFFDHVGDVVDAADVEGDLQAAMSVLNHFRESEDFEGGEVGLYIERVEVKPEYRGQGLAGYAVLRFLDWHDASSDIFAALMLPHTTLEEPDAQERLVEWAKRIGFEDYPEFEDAWMIRRGRDAASWWRRARPLARSRRKAAVHEP